MVTATNGKAKKATRKKVAKKAPKRIAKAVEEIGYAEAPDEVLKVQPLNIGRIHVRLKGTSPLVTHPFDPKSKREMLEKQMKTQKAAGKDPRCPEEEFLNAIYWLKGEVPKPDVCKETGELSYKPKVVVNALKKGLFGLPAAGFKNAVVSAARNTDMRMTELRQGIKIYGTYEDPDWCVINSKQLPVMDARIVRVGNKIPMERFRPKWLQWETDLIVEFDKGQYSQDNVINLLAIAGYFVGVCEGRSEKSALGWGSFEVI